MHHTKESSASRKGTNQRSTSWSDRTSISDSMEKLNGRWIRATQNQQKEKRRRIAFSEEGCNPTSLCPSTKEKWMTETSSPNQWCQARFFCGTRKKDGKADYLDRCRHLDSGRANQLRRRWKMTTMKDQGGVDEGSRPPYIPLNSRRQKINITRGPGN